MVHGDHREVTEDTEKSNRTLIFADKTDTHGFKDRFIACGKIRKIRMLYFVKSLFLLQHFSDRSRVKEKTFLFQRAAH